MTEKDALDELASAVEDVWRRYLNGDHRAPEAFMLRSTWRAAQVALGRDPNTETFSRINLVSQPVDA